MYEENVILKFETALCLAQKYMHAQEKNEVNFDKKKKKIENTYKKKHKQCGKYKYKYKEYTCNKCGVKGHLAKVCRIKKANFFENNDLI